MAEPKRITELFAFVSVDPDGDEGVPAILVGDMWYPMMGADMDRVKSFIEKAQAVANQTGQSVRILKFTHLEQIGEVKPVKGKSHEGN